MRPCDFARMHGVDKGLVGVVLVEVGAQTVGDDGPRNIGAPTGEGHDVATLGVAEEAWNNEDASPVAEFGDLGVGLVKKAGIRGFVGH